MHKCATWACKSSNPACGISLFVYLHQVASASGCVRSFQARWPCANDGNFLRCNLCIPIGVGALVARCGFNNASNNGVACITYLACLVAPNAGANLCYVVSQHFVDQVGVGNLCPSHFNTGTNALLYSTHRHVWLNNRTLQKDRNVEYCVHTLGDVGIETFWFMKIGASFFDGENGATNNY